MTAINASNPKTTPRIIPVVAEPPGTVLPENGSSTLPDCEKRRAGNRTVEAGIGVPLG
jgi:hypothetical protein